jgi:thiamine-phosphate pyrophosphorylase
VLINNRRKVLAQLELDGIHFDDKPDQLTQLRQELNREIIIGITCGNDLSVVNWANDNGLDYVSFCSMFPSSTANSCELVTFDTVKKARSMTTMPLFLAGGIKPGNMETLSGLDYSGIAIVSGIMEADNPRLAIKKYQQNLKQKL